MFWLITTCVAIALLIFTYRIEINTGTEIKTSRILALVALGLSMVFLYTDYIAV